MIRAIACFFGIHKPPPGVNRALSIRWYCDHCGKHIAGGLAWRKR